MQDAEILIKEEVAPELQNDCKIHLRVINFEYNDALF